MISVNPGDVIVGIIISLIAEALIIVFARSLGWVALPFRTIRHVINLHNRLELNGFYNFYASRDDYVRFREAPRLPDYLGLAQKSIKVCALWMAESTEMEGVANAIAELVRPPRNIEVTICIVNPKGPAVDSLASYLDMKTEETRTRTTNALMRLCESRETLAPKEKERFKIKVYNAMPAASVILIDTNTEYGRAQIDIKPYKTPRRFSFSFELRGRGKHLYDLCVGAWERLVEESEDFDPLKHLATT